MIRSARNAGSAAAAAVCLLVLAAPAGAAPGEFGDPTSYANAKSNLDNLATGDFNEDGLADVAIAQGMGQNCPCVGFEVRLASDTGGFSSGVLYGDGTTFKDIQVGDFNGDGSDDLVATTYTYAGNGNQLGIFLGDGEGAFSQAGGYFGYHGGSPHHLAVGDFDGDGNDDFAHTYYYANGVRVFFGNGEGGTAASLEVPTGGGGVFAGDFDNDERDDLVLGVAPDNGLALGVRLGKADRTFGEVVKHTGSDRLYRMDAGDFDGDGNLDLAGATSGPGVGYTMLGNGDGSFGAASTFGGAYGGVAVGDFDVDGLDDVALYPDSGTLTVGISDGDGTFTTTTKAASQGADIAAGDVDGDGFTDLIGGAYAGLRLFLNQGGPLPDTEPPATFISSGPSAATNDTSPEFEFEADEPDATFVCQLDSTPIDPCGTPANEDGFTVASHSVSGPLSDGQHTFSVWAEDSAGNVDDEGDSVSFTVDTVAPDTAIAPEAGGFPTASGPLGIHMINAQFSFSGAGLGGSYECRVLGSTALNGTWRSCGTPWGIGIEDGGYAVEARSTDAAGNTDSTQATQSFAVDTAGPTLGKPKALGKATSGVKVEVKCTDLTPSCSGRVSLYGGNLNGEVPGNRPLFGRKSFTIAGDTSEGATDEVRIRLKAAARRIVNKGNDLEVTALVTAADGLGHEAAPARRNIGWSP